MNWPALKVICLMVKTDLRFLTRWQRRDRGFEHDILSSDHLEARGRNQQHNKCREQMHGSTKQDLVPMRVGSKHMIDALCQIQFIFSPAKIYIIYNTRNIPKHLNIYRKGIRHDITELIPSRSQVILPPIVLQKFRYSDRRVFFLSSVATC